MNMNKILIVMLMCLMIFPLASAVSCTENSLGTFKVGDIISLRQICDSCTYVTLGTVTLPNSTMQNIDANMTKTGIDYSYPYDTNETTGIYYYTVFGDKNGGAIVGETFCFSVTPIGIELTSGKTALYTLIWIVSFLIFVGLLIYGLNAEGNNKRDEMTGYILDVSNTKYLKIFALALCYVILIFLSYFTWMLSFSYLDMPFMSSIFQFMFYALAIATLPLFIVFCYILIANKIRDSKISDMLSRGLRVK